MGGSGMGLRDGGDGDWDVERLAEAHEDAGDQDSLMSRLRAVVTVAMLQRISEAITMRCLRKISASHPEIGMAAE
jgi:hypothetical protein